MYQAKRHSRRHSKRRIFKKSTSNPLPIRKRLIKKYLAFFTLRLKMGLQYRTAALAGVVTQFAFGFMQIMTYKAFYESDPAAFPMTLSATSSYIWLQQAFLSLFAAWMMENDVVESIANGNVAYELCRPIRIYNMWFAKSVANRMARASLRCFPIIIVAALLPYPYGMTAPASALHFVIFLITLILGLLVTVSFCMLVYGLTFFTISPQGLRIVFTSAVEFFAGAIIPLPFFPENIRKIMELLPFASMQNVPLRIYSGDLTGTEMSKTIALQMTWLIILTLCGSLLCRIAERKTTIQGG